MICATVATLVCFFAGPDNNIEWDGVSHVDWLDKRPLCPVDGEAFSVRIQAFQTDVTAVRVHFDDGAVQWVNATYLHDRGPYAIWQADLPSTASTTASCFWSIGKPRAMASTTAG